MRLLTVEQVAEQFQLKVRQVKELARKGKIPAIKVGKLWRFSEDALQDWVESQAGLNNGKSEIDSIAEQIISEVS